MSTRCGVRALVLAFLCLQACSDPTQSTNCSFSGAWTKQLSKASFSSPAAVRVGGTIISKKTIEDEFSALPAEWRRGLGEAKPRQRVIDQIILRRLTFLAAMNEGNREDEAVWAEIEAFAERKLSQAYLKRRLTRMATEPSSGDIEAYYKQHLPEFIANGKSMPESEARSRAKMILTQKRDVDALHAIDKELRAKMSVNVDESVLGSIKLQNSQK